MALVATAMLRPFYYERPGWQLWERHWRGIADFIYGNVADRRHVRFNKKRGKILWIINVK